MPWARNRGTSSARRVNPYNRTRPRSRAAVRSAMSPQPTSRTLMQVIIKPSDHSFDCAADETVLQAAMRADLMIPYGCRNGACGTCKGRILAGEADYGPYAPAPPPDGEKRPGPAPSSCAPRPPAPPTGVPEVP